MSCVSFSPISTPSLHDKTDACMIPSCFAQMMRLIPVVHMLESYMQALLTLLMPAVFAPPLLVLLILAHGVGGAAAHIALCAFVQVCPFPSFVHGPYLQDVENIQNHVHSAFQERDARFCSCFQICSTSKEHLNMACAGPS
jgi:hypothetical protein